MLFLLREVGGGRQGGHPATILSSVNYSKNQCNVHPKQGKLLMSRGILFGCEPRKKNAGVPNFPLNFAIVS